MPVYDFQSLSPEDFELLARDLLQAELRVRLESFAKGRDCGIDFRFRGRRGSLVVQCKHYADFGSLLRVLSRDEAAKVQRLRPKRYILAVSTPLTPDRKDKILELLSPWCRASADIFGREDMNNLLGRFPDVERKHYKLWLTSVGVLTRLLNGGIWGDSELTVERIRQRTSRYVPNPSFRRARKVLEKHGYCIIAGIPGIGKTTLAEILLIDYVDRHGFQAVRIAEHASEIRAVKDPGRRQIFYFDDFLGKTALDKLQKNEEQRLLEFMQEVAANRNWRFILTTREYILNAAKLRYEALAQPPVSLKPSIIELADYTYPIRAKILYNHVFFSDLPEAYKRALLEGRRYEKILRHKNYNPRIIEHMTRASNATSVPAAAYFDNFVGNLKNPVRIWNHAFRYQLSEHAQHALLAMCSLPDEVLLADLEVAFNSLYQHRRAKHGFAASSRDFELALKELDGNFITSALVGKDQVFKFHNPSVADFLEAYLADSPSDVVDLFESACFFDQFVRLWRGQRGTRFSGIDKNSDGFVHALARQCCSPTCPPRRAATIRGENAGARRLPPGLEERAIFAAKVANGLKTAESRVLLDQLLVALQARMESGDADRQRLVTLLRALETRTPSSEPSRRFFQAAAAYLTTGLDELNDFVSVGEFVESFPGAVTEGEIGKIGSAFLDLCGTYDNPQVDTPDDLRSLATSIRRVGSQLHVDVSERYEDLYAQADVWDDELGSGMYEGDDDEEEWGGRDRGEEDVDAMFDRLLHEIDERAR